MENSNTGFLIEREGITKEAREKQRKQKKRSRDDGNQQDSLTR